MQSIPDSTLLPAATSESAIQEPSIRTVEKERRLRDLMREMRSVLVAYSGGVDSSYLGYIANSELGDHALCVIGVSESLALSQRQEAEWFAAEFGLNLEAIETRELDDSRYRANPVNRCYFCKSELYAKLTELAWAREIGFVIDGTNSDDENDIRPGRAAARERSVRSPLSEVGLSKQEIRQLAHAAGLTIWDKPSSPCLSSRIAYGVPVTIDRLSRIERGEDFLRRYGFREFRVRVHGDLARIEISPEEMDSALKKDFAAAAAAEFAKIGFKYVTLDLKGFRSGSMNEVLI